MQSREQMGLRRIRLIIAYDGTDYCGFQLQPEGMPTIEGELNRALTELTGEDITVIGASRTDSGVHSYGNVAVFDTASSIPAERFPLALQAYLPADIRVMDADEVSADWHPRKQNCIKSYEYSYSCGAIEDPKQRLYCSFSRRKPDVEKMRQAANCLIGEHDFTSFANPSSQQLKEGKSAVRNIYSIDITEEPQRQDTAAEHDGADKLKTRNTIVRIRVCGSGFLYNMVRIIAGTLMNVGCGLWEPERVAAALSARDRRAAGPTAEARGLTLLGIEYGDEGTEKK